MTGMAVNKRRDLVVWVGFEIALRRMRKDVAIILLVIHLNKGYVMC
jgi:hypothetical protein